MEKRLLIVNPTEGLAIRIDSTLVDKATKGVKTAIAPNLSGITVDMLKVSGGDVDYILVTHIVN